MFGLLFLGAVAGFGWLLLSSSAVLYSEKPNAGAYGGFVCTYFTGLRSVETFNYSATGCPRLIKVGQ